MALWQLLNLGTGCTVTHCGLYQHVRLRIVDYKDCILQSSSEHKTKTDYRPFHNFILYHTLADLFE
jgi:hypothetical protein